MFDFLRTYQLDIMLALCAASFCFTLLLFVTRFLEKRRKLILIFMEVVSTFLLIFDRVAYMYAGDPSPKGYIMVRVSNFFVYFLTPGIVLGYNLYLENILMRSGKLKAIPKRLGFVSIAAFFDMSMVVMSQFTGMFYYFDENNKYHRGSGFIISYIIPVLAPIILLTVIQQYRSLLSKWIYISLMIYIVVPLTMGIIQIFAYGLSITNIAMVMVSISLYVFTYIDINQTILDVHNNELKILEDEKRSAKRLFDQTATAFMGAVEQRDVYSVGHSVRTSRLARKLAVMMGKSQEECDEIYYAALLHNVGLVGLPDDIFIQKEQLTDEERREIEKVPELSSEILSTIVEYPYLKEAALYSHERYDGSGYPKGLKGKAIPEIARIINVVDAYDAMTSRRSYRGPFPLQTIREEFIRQAGVKYDPDITALMIKLLDQENNDTSQDIPLAIEKEINCGVYRGSVSTGIPIVQQITKIQFNVIEVEKSLGKFSEPAILIFDSFDGYVHDNKKAIDAYHYLEYGEVWFDGKAISTDARNLKVQSVILGEYNLVEGSYEIIMAKFEDHIKIEMMSPKGKIDVIVALPDRSKAAYISLTGENCRLVDINVSVGTEKIKESDIPKIVEEDNFINRMESDVANVQIDQYRSQATEGIPLTDKLKLTYHAMSLPSASLIWHCPYIVLYYSDDKKVYGENYREYALIKINGEVSADEGIVENKFSMKKNESFPGWDIWKDSQRAGIESTVTFARRGNSITAATENLGIYIENKTIIKDGTKDIYVALSGDQVAITDVRIS